VIQEITETKTITVPANYGMSDLHIAFIPEGLSPVSTPTDIGSSTYNGVTVQDTGSVIGKSSVNFSWGAPVCIVQVPSGQATFPNSSGFSTSNLNVTVMGKWPRMWVLVVV